MKILVNSQGKPLKSTEGFYVDDSNEEYLDDVIFIDYDGKVLYRYTKEQFATLQALPANPSHEGLTAQGWNWDLADAKAYVAECGSLVIGQTYITSDNKTRFYITLDDQNYLSPTVHVNSGSTIDWGDGTPEETVSGNASHTYQKVGKYVITMTSSGCPYIPNQENLKVYMDSVRKIYLGAIGNAIGTYQFQFFGRLEEVIIPSNVQNFSTGGAFQGCGMLKAVVLPKNITSIGNYTFQRCCSLKVISMGKIVTFGSTPFSLCFNLKVVNVPKGISAITNFSNSGLLKVTVPSNITAVDSGVFQNCPRLRYVYLPDTVTSIGTYAFSQDDCLTHIKLPSGLTTLNQRAFQGAMLVEVTIPANVTTIDNYAFYSCPRLQYVHVLAETPPVAGSGIFQSTPLAKIYVPQGKLTAYQTATGWSTYANLMEEEPNN